MGISKPAALYIGARHTIDCPALHGTFECECGGYQRAMLEQAQAEFESAHPDAKRLPGTSCSCCGCTDRDEYPVYRAGIIDPDGDYNPRLCVGCFADLDKWMAKAPVRPEVASKRDALAALSTVLHDGELDDAMVSALEDLDHPIMGGGIA